MVLGLQRVSARVAARVGDVDYPVGWDHMGRTPTRFVAVFIAVTALAPGVLLKAQRPDDRTLVRHEFTSSAEGWEISGDTATAEPVFRATGGHPGGCIVGVDEAVGETWYFHAPAAVLKLLPAAVNGTIRFSLKQSGPISSMIDDDVVVMGPAGRISYRFPRAPGTDWTDFSVTLSESAGWTWNWNKKATQAQIESVLKAPTRLEIRGEYITGPDEGALDNFVLTAAR